MQERLFLSCLVDFAELSLLAPYYTPLYLQPTTFATLHASCQLSHRHAIGYIARQFLIIKAVRALLHQPRPVPSYLLSPPAANVPPGFIAVLSSVFHGYRASFISLKTTLLL